MHGHVNLNMHGHVSLNMHGHVNLNMHGHVSLNTRRHFSLQTHAYVSWLLSLIYVARSLITLISKRPSFITAYLILS